MISGIYKITNLINNKVYIGQSNDIKRRWNEHKARYHDINNNCYDKPLYQAFRKYGIENFQFEIIEECSLDIINKQEGYWIKYYNCISPNGYNLIETPLNPYRKSSYCKNCGKLITNNTIHQLCRECYTKSTRITTRPSKEDLYQYLLSINGNFTEAGRHFNVSDNAIRKWCKYYNLPSHSIDYK